MIRKVLFGLAITLLATGSRAHDTWVQTNTNVVRAGDAAHIDLMLGNHGNDHRDFKIAGKKSPMVQPGKSATLKVTLKPGKMKYQCTVPGHAAAGNEALTLPGAFGAPAAAPAPRRGLLHRNHRLPADDAYCGGVAVRSLSVCAAHFHAPSTLTQVDESIESDSLVLPSTSIFWCAR